MIEDGLVGGEDPVREPVLAQELPDVLHWGSSGAFAGSGTRVMLIGITSRFAWLPARLVEQDDSVSAGRDRLRDLNEVQGHGLTGAAGQDQTGSLSFSRADRSEDVGRGRALILPRRWPRAPPRPTAGDLVLLPDPRLVSEPDL